MSRFRRIGVVYRKELVETLRDRRTLTAMIVVPIVLYPALMVILLQALQTETTRRERERYTLCVPSKAHELWLRGVLQREDREQEDFREANRQAAEAQGIKADENNNDLRASIRQNQIDFQVVPDRSMWELVKNQQYQAGVIIEPPPNPDGSADSVNRIAQIIYHDTDPRSEFLYAELTRILSNEALRIVRARVGNDQVLQPLQTDALSTAGPEQQFAKILSMIVPFLLVTMTVTGAMYPAIDLTAGERERGTLETLAVSPVPVGQIVAGKFGVIVTIAMISTFLNLSSMTAMVYFSKLDRLASPKLPTGQDNAAVVQQQIQENLPTGTDTPHNQREYLAARRALEQASAQKSTNLLLSAPVALLAMVPFAILFSGVMLATCSFARTFKEAQNYMMPVMMAAILPAMIVSYMPSVKLEGIMQIIPVANVVVLMRELFLGNYDLPAIGICLLSTSVAAAAAVLVAAKLYGHEAVLFSDVGTYKTLLRRRFFKPRQLPSPAFVLLAIAILFPINFYWQSYMLGLHTNASTFRLIIAIAQVGIIALPAIFLCWYFRIDLRRTFSLARPALRPTLGVLLLAISVFPMSSLLEQIQSYLFPNATGSGPLAEKQIEWFTQGPLFSIVLVFAVLPGICEELLFRGFLLGGLREHARTLPLVLGIGLIFGLYHVSTEKIPIVSLLGMLLTLVCLRCGSIFPAMILHIANNGLALASVRPECVFLRSFYGLPNLDLAVGIHFNVLTAIFALVFMVGLILVLAGPPKRPQASIEQADHADRPAPISEEKEVALRR